jgi:hypothetical protein
MPIPYSNSSESWRSSQALIRFDREVNRGGVQKSLGCIRDALGTDEGFAA